MSLDMCQPPDGEDEKDRRVRLADPRRLRQHRGMDSEENSAILRWMESGAPFGGVGPVRRIDTHAAVILLAGERAWKLKKQVRFGYLDFSTPERRRQALEAELRLNRRSAPQLYLGLHPVTRGEEGRFALDGALDGKGEALDWVLEMRRFPDGALLADRAEMGCLNDPALMRELADHVAALHAQAPPVIDVAGAARLRHVVEGNAASMAAFPAILPSAEAERLTARLLAMVEAQAPLLDARGREGRIRHGHGDLHLGNIALVDGRPVAFDCLEFDPELATADPLYDLAFLLMDLWRRGLTGAANGVFNRYLDLSPQDEGGLALLPLFMAVRASIRAHVTAARADQEEGGAAERAADEARGFLALALRLAESGEVSSRRLVAIGGLSGTGKSTLARALGGDLGPPPGARILRSDVLRKRLAGVAPESALPKEAYGRSSSRAVYGELERLAAQVLEAGFCGIADAVFAAASEREHIRAVAEEQAAGFDGLWLVLPEEGRVARVEGRVCDASDADAAVVRAQSLRHPDSPLDWHILDAAGDGMALAVRARRALGLVAREGKEEG